VSNFHALCAASVLCGSGRCVRFVASRSATFACNCREERGNNLMHPLKYAHHNSQCKVARGQATPASVPALKICFSLQPNLMASQRDWVNAADNFFLLFFVCFGKMVKKISSKATCSFLRLVFLHLFIHSSTICVSLMLLHRCLHCESVNYSTRSVDISNCKYVMYTDIHLPNSIQGE
jgi:hypothetical protein